MKRILIVDAAMVFRSAVRKMLEDYFQIVKEVDNGELAISFYQRLRPDFVLMDVAIPGINAIAAVKEICRIDSGAKVIMISDLSKKHLANEALKSGAKDFLIKPLNREQVMLKLTTF